MRIRAPEPASRRTGQKVRRNSTLAGAEPRGWWRPLQRREKADALVAAEKYDRLHRKPGRRNGPLGHVGLEVYRYLWSLGLVGGGRIEPSIDHLMRALKRSKDAVVSALAALRRHGFLDWLRRYVPAEGQGRRGPQVKQTSNAYQLRLPEPARRLVKRPPLPDDEAQRRAEAETTAAEMAADAAADTPLGRQLGRLG